MKTERTRNVTSHCISIVCVFVQTSPYIQKTALWLITFSYAHCVHKPVLVSPVLSSAPPLGDGCHCCHCHSWPAQQQHRLSAACSMQTCQQIFRAPVLPWKCESVCVRVFVFALAYLCAFSQQCMENEKRCVGTFCGPEFPCVDEGGLTCISSFSLQCRISA